MRSRTLLFFSLAAVLGAVAVWMHGNERVIRNDEKNAENSATQEPNRRSLSEPVLPESRTRAEKRGAENPSSATSTYVSNRIAPIEPSPLARRLFASVSDLGKMYRELKSREATLSGDELLALRNVLLGCMSLASTDEQIKLVPARAALVSSNSQRLRAADISRQACAEIPESELTEKRLSQLSSELNRREHPIVQAETLRAMTELGFGTQSHDRASAFLSSSDPAIMMRVADYLAYEIRLTGMQHDFLARGLNTENLTSGWQLAVCDLTGGCGADSQQLLAPCIVMNRCDVTSLSDYMRKYDAETYASSDKFRQLILTSYQSGDWSWLNLPTLRAKLPA